MANYYYVNKKAGMARIHLVHTANCSRLPPLENRFFLGTFYAQLDAVKQARKYYPQAEICENCGQRPIKKSTRKIALPSAPQFSC
ncbi:hypothetical protein ACTJMU_12785 [Mixta calida]|uniref:hypothetical protein n=2 Tax=Erwiniaceae TaxID=1903409 RepID=UPI0028AB8C87|nr:hypothetical protein [Mixta calida]MDU3815968.1 hypothetical protein [Pantoea sp.]